MGVEMPNKSNKFNKMNKSNKSTLYRGGIDAGGEEADPHPHASRRVQGRGGRGRDR